MIGPAGSMSPLVEGRRVSVEAGAASQQTQQPATEPSAAPASETYYNPVMSVDPSGVLIVQYRDPSGDVRLQIPSEQALKAYESKAAQQPETKAAEPQAADARATAATQPQPQPQSQPPVPAARDAIGGAAKPTGESIGISA